jgi:hypothetical protein
MNTRPLLLSQIENLKRNELVKHIMTMTVPDASEIDSWAMGIFEEDPKADDCLERRFVVFGKLQDCVGAVAGCLSRQPKPSASKLRLVSRQGEVNEIDCKSNDFCL